MSKKAKEGRRGNSLHNYFLKNNNEDKNTPQANPKNQPRKRPPPPTPPPPPPKTHPLYLLARPLPLALLLEKCPRLAEAVAFLEGAGVRGEVARGLAKKYLQSSSRSLWGSKYAPSECGELFNSAGGQQIRDWLSAFFEYKNKILEESDSFLNDFEEQSCRVLRKVREQGWALGALVVRGRAGTGKAAAVRAVAREMEVELQECGNHYNQTKYLREKNESTQSESVKTAITRRPKPEKNAQRITKFMPPLEREKASENRKAQLIHNFGQVFPEAEAPRFYAELSRCVENSKIPFILTGCCERLPRECEKYDVVEFECGPRERVEEALWAIYHLERTLGLDTLVELEEHALFDNLNQQLAQRQPQEVVPLRKVRDLCLLFNYRLDSIFTFLQHHALETANLRPLFIEKYRHFTQETFLEEISLLAFHKNGALEDSQEKPEESGATTQESQEREGEGLEEYLRRLKIACVEDTAGGLSEGEKVCVGEWEADWSSCVAIGIHLGVKRALTATANLEINCSDRYKSTLRPSELQLLPMLIKEKRSSRNAKSSDDAYLKFFSENQCIYLKQFGHLIRNQ